jgi:hypothetical protein
MPTVSSTAGSYGIQLVSLADGEAVVIDARQLAAVTVRVGTGGTATCSAVDSGPTAKAANGSVTPTATTGAENASTVAANTFANLITLLGPHPFYRISVAGGTCRIAGF